MGCKYSKVIPRGKQEERARSSKSRREELNKVVVTANANRRDLSTEEILDDLYFKGIINNPKKRGGGVAFDIGQTDLPPKPPRRLEEIKKPEVDIMYTAEEKTLVAEILRKDDAKEMGWKRDLKQDKAKSRRMLKETETKAKVENKRNGRDGHEDGGRCQDKTVWTTLRMSSVSRMTIQSRYLSEIERSNPNTPARHGRAIALFLCSFFKLIGLLENAL